MGVILPPGYSRPVTDLIAARLVKSWALLGDSITRYNMIRPNNPSAGILDTLAHEDQGYLTWANRASGGAFYTDPNYNFGLGGDTTEPSSSGPGMNTRVPDILALARAGTVQGCVVMAGTNDLTSGIPADSTISNIQAMVRQLTAAGLCVVLLSITPRQTWGTLSASDIPAAQRARVHINRTLKRWAETQPRVVYIDLEPLTARQGVTFGGLTSGGATSVVLDPSFPDLATTDDAYRYMWLYVCNSVNLGTPRLITGYTASTRTLTLLGSSWPTHTGALVFAATVNTITRASGSWWDDGFVLGSAITISGTTSNNGGGSCMAISDDGLVLTTSRSLIDETDASATVAVTTPTSASTVAIDPRGAPTTDYAWDSLHPSVKGASLHGKKIAELAAPFVISRQNASHQSLAVYHPTDNPTGNLLTNGGFQGAGATVASPFSGSLARGWSAARLTTGGAPTQSLVLSKVARTDIIGGEWQRLELSVYGAAGNEQYSIRQIIKPSLYTYSVGDVLEMDAYLQVSGISRVNELTLQAYWTNDAAGTSQFVMDGRNQTHRGTSSTLMMFSPDASLQGVPLYYRTPKATVGDFTGASSPQLVAQILINVEATGGSGSPATITLDIGQVALRKVL